jgi:L-ascorbate metabolism protein UlaG (beta-lactamase superfamily)
MTNRVDTQRLNFGIAVLGGPTTLIDIAGQRILADPTFDPPGEHGYLTKLAGPPIPEQDLGPVDIVLVSHDNHPDNLDTTGRAFALAAPHLFAGPASATRLGDRATPLPPWQAAQVGTLTITAVPAVHGPADGERDADGNVNTEVIGFVLTADNAPTVYVSGDNASIAVVTDIARRIGPIDVAVLFIGAARVPTKERNRPLTLTSQRAAAAAEILNAKQVVPAHYDSWAHFSEGRDQIVDAFDEAGLSAVLRVADRGEWHIS